MREKSPVNFSKITNYFFSKKVKELTCPFSSVGRAQGS